MDYISSNFPVSGLPIQQFCMSRISQFLVHIFSSFACPGVKKKNFSVELESLRLEFIVGKIFPQMLYLGREPTKTEHLGKKKFPQWISSLRVSRSTGEIFWPQMLCLGREPTKTEHLGEKNFPSGSRVLESRDPLGKFFGPICSV